MDRFEQAALYDFVASIVWPSRTVRVVTTPAGETVFSILGVWDTTNDKAIAWINGNRVFTAVTLTGASQVTLAVAAPFGSQVIIYVTPGAGSGYLPRTGLAAMLGALDMGSQRIKNLGASVLPSDAVRRDEVLALAAALLGGNYLLLTGGTMTGDILLPSTAVGSLSAQAAVRKNIVALLDGSQPFTGKQAGVSTVDADAAGTLVTKDYLLAKIAAVSASFPNTKQIITSTGTTVFNVPAGVTKLFIQLRGGNGGNGGVGKFGAPKAGGVGGSGGMAIASLTVVPGGTVTIRVGPFGSNGVNATGNDFGGGGGGGGATDAAYGALVMTAGGGGGGSGGNGSLSSGGFGGAGGVAGNGGTGSAGAGGAPGNTNTIGGGTGGASAATDSVGNPGSIGSGVYTGAWNQAEDWMFNPETLNSVDARNGFAILRWYQ